MSEICKLKIKNFGPIKNGYSNSHTDDFFDISRCSVIIGEQGTGKSTVAKLVSTLLWLEKYFVQKEQDYSLFTENDFLTLCKNQRIESYFTDKTYFCFKGSIFTFEYKDKDFFIKQNEEFTNYEGKKIMYMPSERNLISVIDDADEISGLPYSISSTVEEFLKASKQLGNDSKKLPLNGFNYLYDKATNTGFIQDNKDTTKVKLSAASSGLQSFVPLFIVTDYLSNNVTKDFFEKLKRFSIKDMDRAENLIRFNLLQQDKSKIDNTITSFRRACDTGLTKDLSDSDVKMLMEQLKSIMNISFCNIVEEPEQNLFPASQIETIKYLVSCLNSNKKNSLLITTHSPFVLSALNNFIFAAKLSSDELPDNLYIYSKDFTAYLVQDGNIINIFDKQYDLIDTTVIDDCATLLNTQYDSICNQEIKND